MGVGINKEFLKKASVIGLLAIIVLLSFYARSFNNIPDKMLSYDPIFQYRFTRYYVEFGQLPEWDELSYYAGRAVSTSAPGLIFYLTALLYSFTKSLGWSLMTTATFASAWFGALIAVPAFLLARELSNKWGGLLGATLTSFAPQVLVRTFGASFDTDQLAIFFILLTLWAGIYALKRKTVFSMALASTCFLLFAAAWQTFWYTFFFLAAGIAVYVLMEYVSGLKSNSAENVKKTLASAWSYGIVMAVIFLTVMIAAYLIGLDPIRGLLGVLSFAQEAEKQIVNISIAELQLIDVTSIDTWMLAIGKFTSGLQSLDNLFFLSLVALMLYGITRSYRTDKVNCSFLLAIVLVSFYTITRGIRFTEFSSGLLLAASAAGFGYLVSDTKARDPFLRSFSVGIGIFLSVTAVFLGVFIGQQLGPDTSQSWEQAWTFFRTETPELSLVGTWWDPGHMIAGQAERRVMADGAHCADQCLYGINDRITSLGKIMATDNENVSLELINKYRGTSPKVYWIASDDLISKYQWLQYFGLGCDARTDARCQLYSLIGLESVKYDQNGYPIVKVYGPLISFDVGGPPIMIYVSGKNAAMVDEVIYYADDGTVKSSKGNSENQTALVGGIEPLVKQLGYRMSNQTVPITLWRSRDSRTIVVIPPNLRNTVFTRMFFFEGQGLEHFKQVFRNEQVKIYEVVF